VQDFLSSGFLVELEVDRLVLPTVGRFVMPLVCALAVAVVDGALDVVCPFVFAAAATAASAVKADADADAVAVAAVNGRFLRHDDFGLGTEGCRRNAGFSFSAETAGFFGGGDERDFNDVVDLKDAADDGIDADAKTEVTRRY